MLKVRALIVFEDYKEQTTRQIGDIFEVSEERLNQILTQGGAWVEVVEEQEQDEEQDISKLKRSELEKIAKDKGIPEQDIKEAGNKEELIKIIKGLA
jgi:hypothetical protein|nr:MAG TPA: dimeris T4 recombination endonuclease VII [Caudoviricetes sp.]